MSEQVKTRKKLIEVTLPLDKINEASAREKSIRHGHPSTLHLWWARRPLAAARAVIFSQMVDDPSEYVDELLAVAENRRRAEQELELRRTEWDKLKALHEQALQEGKTSVAAPGTEATLRGCAADLERERLFDIIKQLVLWENTTNEGILGVARDEIWKSWRRTCEDNKEYPRAGELFNPKRLPPFHDPFAGGGSLPLEAQRLGLEAYASDLNPVAVLINKAIIEIPPRFAGLPPVHPKAEKQQTMNERWRGAQGLAEDVRYYGRWMRTEAEKRIGHLYPQVEITAEMAKERPDLKPLIGRKLTVIAWLWARTVKSPNPAFGHVDVPIASSFLLYSKQGKEVYVDPVVDGDSYRFVVKTGKPIDAARIKNGTKVGRGGHFQCVLSGAPMPVEYIRRQGIEGKLGHRLMAIVVASDLGRTYLSPRQEDGMIASKATPSWVPEQEINHNPRDIRTQLYGLTKYCDLFTHRQLMMLSTFSDLVHEVRDLIKGDARAAGLCDDGIGLEGGGKGVVGYADAVATYLGEVVSKITSYHCTLGVWRASDGKTGRAFGRQAIPMVWDYPEANPFAGAGGDWEGACNDCAAILSELGSSASGHVAQAAAQQSTEIVPGAALVSTDPPYYDNVEYADLSDFFYVWLRRSLREVFPDLLATVVVPKGEELVASPYRHGTKDNAEAFFLDGMTNAMRRLAGRAHPGFPVTIYYAFKQSENEGDQGTSSTGWETFLDAVIRAGFTIDGTWPIRTEQAAALKATVNALASSIVLVCRPQLAAAPVATRREFVSALRSELPIALAHLQRGNIAPVDLAQAAIGPGMAVFTRYSKVVDAEGTSLLTRDALSLINQTLDEVLAEQEGDFDTDTRWAVAWFEQAGFSDGEYGVAETLSTAKNTSVSGLEHAGILRSKGGKVRLLRPDELRSEWDPVHDSRITIWEVVHHLVRRLESGGEEAAAEVVAVLGGVAEIARELAYRLFTICERKKRAPEALSYNALVQSWPEISRLARERESPQAAQAQMFQ